MFLRTLITTIIFLGVFFTQPLFAKEEAVLFWGTTCPYCEVVIKQIEERGLAEKVDIEKLEIYENKDNLQVFYEKIGICNISANSAGVPLLFSNNECYVGVDPILARLNVLAGVDGEVLSEEVAPVAEVEEKSSEGKKNTEIMLFGGILGLALMVVLGSAIQNRKKASVVSVFLLVVLGSLSATPVSAMCPVCTVAVGAGLGFSRYLGIDDVITGVWIGGMIISATMWMINWLEGRKMKKVLNYTISIISMYGVLALSLYFLDVVGHPFNTLWGVDKIVLGIISGTLVFWIFAELHLYLKKKNGEKVCIPFQKVVFTVGSLLLLTAFFYLIVY